LRRFADSVESGEAFTIQIGGERLRVPARRHASRASRPNHYRLRPEDTGFGPGRRTRR
jgi:hypothetical protein